MVFHTWRDCAKSPVVLIGIFGANWPHNFFLIKKGYGVKHCYLNIGIKIQ